MMVGVGLQRRAVNLPNFQARAGIATAAVINFHQLDQYKSQQRFNATCCMTALNVNCMHFCIVTGKCERCSCFEQL